MIEKAVKKSVLRIRSGRDLDSFDKVDDCIILSVGDYYLKPKITYRMFLFSHFLCFP